MNRHKKHSFAAIALIMVLAILLSFTACSDDDSSSSTTKDTVTSVDDETVATVVASALAQAVTDGIEFSATGTVGDITLGSEGKICIEVDGVVFDESVTVTFEYNGDSVTVDASAEGTDDGCVVTIESENGITVYGFAKDDSENSSSYIYIGLNGTDSAIISSIVTEDEDCFSFSLAEGVTLTVSGTGHADLYGTYASLDSDGNVITLTSDYTADIGQYEVTIKSGSTVTAAKSSVTVDASATIDGEKADVSFIYNGESISYFTVNGLFSYVEEDVGLESVTTETTETTETTTTTTVTTSDKITIESGVKKAAVYLLEAINSTLQPVSLTASVTGESSISTYTYTNGTFGDITVSFTTDGITYSIASPNYGETITGDNTLQLTFSDGSTVDLDITLYADGTYTAAANDVDLAYSYTSTSSTSSETSDDGTTTSTTVTTYVLTFTAYDESTESSDNNYDEFSVYVAEDGTITFYCEYDEYDAIEITIGTNSEGNTTYTYTYTTTTTEETSSGSSEG